MLLIVSSITSCGTSSIKEGGVQENTIDDRSVAVVELLSKQVDSASGGLLKFKNFQKQDGGESGNGNKEKGYDDAMNFIASIVAERDCYWNFPSNLLYNGRVLKQIVLDVNQDEDSCKPNVSFVKSGLGIPVEGVAYFRKAGDKLLIFDYTIKVHESVVSK